MVANIHTLFPSCNNLTIELQASTNFIGYNMTVYQMMQGMKIIIIINLLAASCLIILFSSLQEVFPLFCCDTPCVDCYENHRTEKDKGETIRSEENMITRQVKEFSTQGHQPTTR
jgi:hypothetical protein